MGIRDIVKQYENLIWNTFGVVFMGNRMIGKSIIASQTSIYNRSLARGSFLATCDETVKEISTQNSLFRHFKNPEYWFKILKKVGIYSFASYIVESTQIYKPMNNAFGIITDNKEIQDTATTTAIIQGLNLVEDKIEDKAEEIYQHHKI